MTQVAQRNNHVLQMLKRLRETLDNEKKKYADKVNVLVMTWERIAASAREQRPLAAICIVEKMYKDTLSIMLQGEWPKMSPVSKTHLVQMLHRCRKDLCKEMPWLNSKFRKLLELVNDPWTLPSLERILHRDPSPPTPEQIVEFCESERGLLIVTRLTMLCSSRCEKVAIKLAEACFGALSGGNPKLLSYFTVNEYNFIFDIYLCLLYKYRKLEFIINALKTVSVADGYYLVVRLRKRSDFHEQKIWKFSHQVAAVAARYFVTVSMLARSIPNSTLLKNLISDWLAMCKPGENNVENEVRKVIQPAETSEHIYLMAEVLTVISQKLRNQMYSSLIMELYIRALTADINYLERVKLQNDKEQMTAYEKHLASKFLALADLVKDHSGVRREFVLTAFSIHPSAEIYRRVEEEAVASGKASPHSASHESIEVGVLSEGLSSLSSEENEGKDTVTDYSVNNDSQDSGAFVEISNRCPLHLPYDGPDGELCFQCGDFTGTQTLRSPVDQQQKKKERSLDALILIKGNTVTESLNYDVLSAPSQVLEAEKLGLSSQVCADLVTLLGSNRYHLLTWVLEWGELSSRCLRYMDEADTIKSGKKELKFLDIDYNQYKDWPENDDEADCIEKGYEQWLEDDNTETDFDSDSKRSNTEDSEEIMIKTAIKKSQKQIGRYAESSSDSEDSRSRPRNRKRGRPRKRLKSLSDSGSVSDSLGSDGQKQKPSSKKLRKKSKDLRKTLGRLKVQEEMTSDSNNLSFSNDCLSPETISGKVYGLPISANGRSDPTVLKSLRAFRPNAHKTKNDDLIQSVTENCYNSKTISGKMVANKKSTVFDCNDNKFITKGDRFSFGGKDVELHFRTGGVRTKKYNDVIRTIKEDLMSLSNIPNVANNAMVNVVHVHDSQKSSEDSSQSVQSNPSGGQQIPSSSASSPAARNANSNSSIPKPKPDGGESPGSQLRKSTSSQTISQNAVISYSNSPVTTAATILTSALTRVNSAARPGGTLVTGNQILSAATVRPSGSKVVTPGQPQFMAIVNRNAFHSQSGTGQDPSNSDGRNVPNAVVGFVNSNSVKTTGQHFITQATRAPVQTARVVAVPTVDNSTFLLESDRPNVILSKNFVGVQNVRTVAPTLYNHVVSGLNNGSNQVKKVEDSNSDAPSLIAGQSADESTQIVSNSRLPFESTVQNNMSPSKVTILSTKLTDFQNHANETADLNVIAGSTSGFANASKPVTLKLTVEGDGNFQSRSNSYSKNSGLGTNALSGGQSPSPIFRTNNSKAPHTVILQSTVSPTVGNRNISLSEISGSKRTFSLVKPQASNNSERNSSEQQEEIGSRSGSINNGSGGSQLTSIATTTTTTANFGYRNYGSPIAGKSQFNEVVRIVQGTTNLGQNAATNSGLSEMNASAVAVENQTSGHDGTEVVAIIDSSSNVKLDSVVPGRNVLATVLKRSSVGNLLSTASTSSTSSHYPNSRNPMEMTSQGDGVQNVMISQSSNSSTIHYTVVNPIQQEIQQDGLSSISGDLIERVVKENNFNSPESMMSPLIEQIENAVGDFSGETEIPGMDTKSMDKYESLEEVNVSVVGQDDGIESESNRSNDKSNSSPPSTVVQPEGSFIKKQGSNNQKITILVENNEGDRDRSENRSKNKSSEFLCRDDQRTCITFRAIKRTQSDSGQNESPAKKKTSTEVTVTGDQNGNGEDQNQAIVSEIEDQDLKNPANSSESLCQYLVLEAINDPAGALPKFNQAFGKSYQVKIPQAIKPADTTDTRGNEEGIFSVTTDQVKPDGKSSEEEMRTNSLAVSSIGETSSREINAFEIVQKPVKSVYIDKEVKLNVQHQSAANKSERDLDSSTSNISTIQMTEVQQQQPGSSNYQTLPTKTVARSSVVQQLLRKVPNATVAAAGATAGATPSQTIQAVNSIGNLTAKQMKTQDVVSGSTLIYATENRAQSQIVIQRAVGRVNTSGISQVAPVIYTQNPGDHAPAQTQTLLLAAVPAGTRGVAPGTQLLRIPSSSGVWKMTSSANPPRIVQLRPQNLVLQSGQDQGLLMQGGQSVLLQHLTSLPVKPIGVVASNAKADQTAKIDVKNDMYSKPEMNMDDVKMCSVPQEVDQSSAKSETSSPAATVSEHETVSLMKDIKEFENVFEETKLKFEMEEQQGVCLPEVESIPQVKNPIPAVNVQAGATAQPIHQTVLVQPQLMLHKPQMIITSAVPNQPTIFTQKIEKQLTLEKEPEKRLILTTKPKLAMDDASQSHVAVAYVSHSTPTSVNVQNPLVVVTNYAQPPTSPAPSITSQNSSSPNSVVSSVSFTSTGNSSCKTPTKSKSRGIKTVLNPSKSPPVAKPQQKPQEDANTAQKIYAILEEYAVQLRNSPDMNNRPAPRRRSNPPASSTTKRKKTVCKSKESFSDGDEINFVEDNTEPLPSSEDSSSGVTVLQVYVSSSH